MTAAVGVGVGGIGPRVAAGRRRVVGAWALAALGLGPLGAAAVTADGGDAVTARVTAAIVLPTIVIGLLLVTRRPGSSVGVLLVAVGAVPAIDLGLYSLGWRLAQDAPFAVDVLVNAVSWPAWYAAPTLLALTFPDGTLLSPRWRAVVVAVLLVPLPLGLGLALDPTTYAAGGGHLPGAAPAGVPAWVVAVAVLCGLGGLVATLSLGVASLVLRYRRGGAVLRLQIRWLAVGLGVLPATLAAVNLAEVLGAVQVAARFGVPGLALGAVAMPVAIAVAVLRHGLWDLDRLVSRTLAYLVVTGALVAVYAVVVTSLPRLLPVSSSLAVALATLAAAALFRPVLGAVQRTVDRRFNRERYDARSVVEAFGSHLRQGTDPDSVASDLLAVVARTVDPVAVGLWVRDRA